MEPKRGHDPGVIGRPKARWRSISRVIADDVRGQDPETATVENMIDAEVENRHRVEQIGRLATGRNPASRAASRNPAAITSLYPTPLPPSGELRSPRSTTGSEVTAGPLSSSAACALWMAGVNWRQGKSRPVLIIRKDLPRILTSTAAQPRKMVIGPMIALGIVRLVTKVPLCAFEKLRIGCISIQSGEDHVAIGLPDIDAECARQLGIDLDCTTTS